MTGDQSARMRALMALESEIGVLVRRIRRVIAERAAAVHPELQPATYLMLGAIRDRGPVRASEIAELFAIDKGAISRQVTQLIELGLVAKEPDPADARASLLSVTAEAVRRLDEVSELRRAWLDQRLDGWSETDLDHFVTELSRYNAALNA